MEITIDIDEGIPSHHSERDIMLRLFVEMKHVQHELRKIERRQTMIAQEIINASAKALQDASANIIAHLPPSTTASTPDTAVTGLLGVVDSVTAALNAAAGPATPTPGA